MTIKIKGYNETKYEAEEKAFEITYSKVADFKVIAGDQAKEIEDNCDEEMVDEYGEYLVITFEDGETSTFRNSHVDLFIV